MPRCRELAARLAATLLSLLAVASSRAIASESHGEIGLASYYGCEFDSLPTASGERFDMRAMTAAHRTLPFGTRVRVTNIENGRSMVVRINDRGPFVKGRVLDLSYGAARRLGLVGVGVGPVEFEVLPPDTLRESSGGALATRRVVHGAHLHSRRPYMESLWRRRSTVPWGPIAARIDVTKGRFGMLSTGMAPAGT
jgi:rare lipoprotein A (peptidoglycan hydrolase)